MGRVQHEEAQHPYHRASRLLKTTDNYSFDLPAALALAHLAFAAAARAARPAALNLRFRTGLADGVVPLIAAHLAFWAARILATPAALIFFRAFLTGSTAFAPPFAALYLAHLARAAAPMAARPAALI
jgi:hypothetical protein